MKRLAQENQQQQQQPLQYIENVEDINLTLAVNLMISQREQTHQMVKYAN